MKNNEVKYTEKDLLTYIQQIRLLKALELHKIKMDSVKNEKIDSEASIGAKIADTTKKFGHWIKKTGGNYNKLDDITREEYDEFKEKNTEVINEDEAKKIIDEIFKDDQYGLTRLVFASTVILDDEYEYRYCREGLEEASKLLYNDADTMTKIKESLEENYNAIAPKSLSNVQKGLLVGFAVTSLIGMIAMPVLIGSTGGLIAATGLFAAEELPVLGASVGLVTAEYVIASAALTGIAYGSMKLFNNARVKKAFRNLTPEANALYLAIQATYIERIKEELGEEEYKEQLDSILRNLNSLKSDNDYYLFVEHEQVKDNKAKMNVYHSFDKRLVKVLGL